MKKQETWTDVSTTSMLFELSQARDFSKSKEELSDRVEALLARWLPMFDEANEKESSEVKR